MAVNIEMPKLSDTMTEGTLIKWHKKVGDVIEIGDIIADIETDKATMEMEAFDEGTITSILVEEGQKAPISSILAILDGSNTSVASPVTASNTQNKPIVLPEIEISTSHETIKHSSGDRIKSSPLARKIATENQIDLSQVSGSGPGGRILRKDVEQATDSDPKMAAEKNTQAIAAASLATAAKNFTKNQSISKATPVATKAEDQIIPLSSLRKIIASRLLESKQTIPHFYLHTEVDAAPLMDFRKQINDQFAKTNIKYSVNDFIVKALIQATQAVPAINSSFAEDHIIRHQSVGISVAIAIEDGLFTPVIKNAENKSLQQISTEIKDFAIRAKDRKLRPDEFDGGTITISNLGAWGIDSFDAIVNPPQAAILSVGAVIEKPVVRNGQVVPGLRMNLGLSADHRVVDGAIAASFLSEIKKLVENPILMLL
jgi:pyruvate dehydrogenase E2 component (dihydrolipoamide acetyltransferase)